ncbi:hypothetical protein CA11_40590 [Gimesia maris]|uniref:hypothetical protein n=1 Tax=Gimesia maris TaxID=122 RepID=UPI001189E2C7|nr:hypothetical protein [Gimesia maris]QDU16230.1 hypothetical protein CA11_40590 [Gimesia maris]
MKNIYWGEDWPDYARQLIAHKRECAPTQEIDSSCPAPELLYLKDLIEYRHGKSRILVTFARDGGVKVLYKKHLSMGTTFINVTTGTDKATEQILRTGGSFLTNR